ncbi:MULTISPECIES: acetate--CoA ligase family protein [Roseobacteraceae]|uniref:Succinate--CoA ligase [ADP-forming] subunit alpha n=1 Tax=Pseudosulfitobacter pseudonitzschiae TaxID=1402135 RepID=A0A221K5L9_9RHOB|nr:MULTISPECIES: acetate--CoA ligase family protein [Roseobacteraceae]ASM74147.1 succinate--CoA ligase [ADP-forming] subunit alpha [Pseudosulfitobacter pseudonitzschiae]
MDGEIGSLQRLFYPRSIAVIGASSDPGKIGGRPIDFLKRSGFEGRIVPVNPKAATVQGLPAFRSIGDAGQVDLAICAVPGKFAEQVVDECVAASVGALVMFSSGFAELGDEGREIQERMAAKARAGGMRMVGPNCMGVATMSTGMVATFHPAFAKVETLPRDGRIALISQSGAFGGLCVQMANNRGIGISHMVTTGNEGDVDVSDALAELAQDPNVDVILIYLEGCRNGPGLIRALEIARANRKPVVAVKLGRTEVGAEAAQSHTAALAGSDAVFDAMFRQFGVYRARNIEEFLDIGCALSIGGLPANNRIAIVTPSGGVGILMADEAEERGLDVAPLPETVQRRFKELIPFAGVRNPLDVTAQVVSDLTLFEQALELVLTETDFGSVVCFLGAATNDPNHGKVLLESWDRVRAAHPDRLMIAPGMHPPEVARGLEAKGTYAPIEPTYGPRAVAAAWYFTQSFANAVDRPAVTAGSQLPKGQLNEIEAMDVLGAAGLPVITERLAKTAEEAVTAAREIGFPVVMKLLSPDILHKSDIGGVKLGLRDEAAVHAAFAAIMEAGATVADARIDGCVVAPMVSGDGVETILGVTIDPTFGPVVMFGLGGVLVEAMGDVSFRVAPVDHMQARAMIDEIRARKVLDGVRGAPPSDLGALADAIVALSVFAAAHADQLVSIEANPVLVRPDGQGAIALDAVVVTK